MNSGKMGMSRKSIWSCCWRRAEVETRRKAFRRSPRASFSASTRSASSARARSASSSRRRSSASASSSPRSAERASMVRLDEDFASADAGASASDDGWAQRVTTEEKGRGASARRARAPREGARPQHRKRQRTASSRTLERPTRRARGETRRRSTTTPWRVSVEVTRHLRRGSAPSSIPLVAVHAGEHTVVPFGRVEYF